MDERAELVALRRLAELEAKAGAASGFDPSQSLEVEPPAQAHRSLGQELWRQGGLTARAALNAAASVPLVAAEGGAGIGNLINRAAGRESNYSPTADFDALLTRAGLPQAETPIEKGVQFFGTAMLGARMPGQIPTPAASPAERVIAEGTRHHVPVYYDDVGGPLARKVGTTAENLGSLGTGSGRAIQAKAAGAAASELVQKYAPAAGDDVPVLIQEGLRRRLSGFKTAAGRLYAAADRALAGNGQVDVSAVRSAIAARIAKEEKLGSAADKGTIAALQKYLDAPDGDFAHWRQLRAALGNDISDYYSGNAAIGSRGVDALQEVKTALEDAMGTHAKQSGGAGYDAWRRADAFYRNNIVPFKEAGFRDLVKTAEPEKAWRYLLAHNTGSRAVRMLNGLDRKGREAVKYGLLKEAEAAATTPKGTFSPAKFAKYLEDHDEAVGTFFKGSQKADIDGFRNLMRHIERAGQYAENPPTGNRLVMPLLGGAAFISPQAAATVATGGLATRVLFQTQRGRNFMLHAAKLKPGSPEMAKLLDAVNRYVAAASVSGRASDDPQ